MIKAKQGVAAILVILLTLSIMTAFSAPVLASHEEDKSDEETESDNQVQADEEPEITVPEENEKVEEEEEGEEEEEIEREVETEVGDKEVKIESTLSKEGAPKEIENKFELEFDVDEKVEMELKYAEEVETENIEREIELEFKVKFDSIVEFVDNNGDGLYDEGEEISVYELDGAEFMLIDYVTNTIDNLTMHTISTQTTDGVFKATLHVAGRAMSVGGELVKPNEVKIDIEITNFPYQENDSKLALKTELESTMETEEEKREIEGTNEEEVQVTSGNYGGFFSWKKTALVDGVSREVKSTAVSEDPEEGEKEFYLIYEHGDKIVHDPKIGVRGAIAGPIAEINWTTVIVAAIVAALVSIGVTSLMLKRKGY